MFEPTIIFLLIGAYLVYSGLPALFSYILIGRSENLMMRNTFKLFVICEVSSTIIIGAYISN